MAGPRRVLFFKPEMAWPRSSGHDVHTFNLMKSMAALGVEVGLATLRPSPDAALAGAGLARIAVLGDQPGNSERSGLTRLQDRFRSYWGLTERQVTAFGALARDFSADATVVSGLDVLPLLGPIESGTKVWYAGDEWVWHHLSLFRLRDLGTWSEVRDAAVKALYERAYRSRIDRVWVVSKPDARAMTLISGVPRVDVIPNGVDTAFYTPCRSPVIPETAVFWGRLDFGPNIQALSWFCRAVWPAVTATRPAARFIIIGFQPTRPVELLARIPGVELRPNVPDIRTAAAGCGVVVLPFVSGGGIKNKLLEAAAMGKAIVCSPRSLTALNGEPAVRTAAGPSEWVDTLLELWADDVRRTELGEQAREWVVREHTWERAAKLALASLGDVAPAAGTA